jgi:hypothetical protein
LDKTITLSCFFLRIKKFIRKINPLYLEIKIINGKINLKEHSDEFYIVRYFKKTGGNL